MTRVQSQPIHPPAGSPAPDHRRADDITLAHGGGGQLTDQLLHGLILPRLGNDLLNRLTDSAVFDPLWQDRPALTIDSYVVSPWRFPGGDVGILSVCGTVNDLVVSGARPVGIALGVIMAEGFARRDLETVLDSVARASALARVPVVTGDTKVVGRGQADGIYLTTAGLGRRPPDRHISIDRVRPGDRLVISGPIGEHGLAVMLHREMPELHSVLRTDAAPLNHLVEAALTRYPHDIVFMRDPTRSGLAGVAADLARDTALHVVLDEPSIPVRPEARHAADMLGLDPLEIANEGVCLFVVRSGKAAGLVHLLNHLEHTPGAGGRAAIIGQVTDRPDGLCELRTHIGGSRIVTKPYGEQLPRIC